MHILLVEDNPLVASGTRTGLTLLGFTCDIAPDAATATHYMQNNHVDACVLDLGLPDGDGIALLQQWRDKTNSNNKAHDTPVLILTARDSLDDKLQGFSAGADDYLTKPFELQELAVRLHALLRRARGRSTDLVELGDDCQVDMSTGEVHRHGERVELARREWALLSALMQARGRPLSAAQLHDSLYGFDGEVESNTVNVHVHHLRRKLGADVIETVRGVGFRLGARYCAAPLP